MTARRGARCAPLRIGLTGGIASGKSTVAEMFRSLGAPIIDTDVIAREVVAPGRPALDDIRERFGSRVLTAEGELDRAAMRLLVFSDEHMRKKLEEIVHPRIRDETFRQASAAGGPYQILVVPLLAESPLRHFVDRVLVVDCDQNTQVERLLARDTDTREQAERILAAQARREDRLAIADDVIINEGALDTTRKQVARLHDIYVELAKSGELQRE